LVPCSDNKKLLMVCERNKEEAYPIIEFMVYQYKYVACRILIGLREYCLA